MKPIPVGPFDLTNRLCSGGMGEIWRGIHRENGVPVALKVITRAHAREPRYLSAFRHEVQAVVKLDHPGIVMVFDVGEITRQAEAASEGSLIAGSPYLVMEYASYGSLSQIPLPLGWRDLRTLLLFLLDTLAHSHARGVIHRDLKPGNVLFAGPTDWRPGPKLTDFGIAHALGTVAHGVLAKTSMGSPPYMAPEQWQDEWRDYGPWTDLYGLGCLAYHLATGVQPFVGRDHTQIAKGHLSEPPPRISPTLALPEGFEGWLFRLLQKDFRRRFRRAADAAAALLRLREPPAVNPASVWQRGEPPTGPVDPMGEATTTVITYADKQLQESPTLVFEAQPTAEMEVPATALRTDFGDYPVCPIWPVVIPESWERPLTSGPSMQLVGAGLGLYGLRPVPLVNRKSELDVLWQALKEATQQERPLLYLLRGEAGYGKSRIAQWLCERAHELGAAIILKAVHSPIAGPGAGLSRMVAAHLQCIGLTRGAMLERTRHLLQAMGCSDEYEWHALTELMSPGVESDKAEGVPTVRFGQATERYALIRRLLQRIAQERPVIVWLDDVQWGSDALGFAEYLIRQPVPSPLPVLVILTTHDEGLAGRPVEDRQVKNLLRRRHTRQLVIGPLAPRHCTQLVRSLLYLEGELAGQVVQRSSGNPLFAVQLVGDWVRRGVLVVGERGFELKPGEQAALPDDIHMIWTARIERVLDEFATPPEGGMIDAQLRDEAEAVLEIGAVLGRQVDWLEWEGACRKARIPCSTNLVDLLVSSRLAFRGQSNWTFEHSMLAESLQRRSREAGRWQGHNRVCAAMLQARYPNRTKAISERLGLHLYEAGDLDSALEPLIQGVFQRVRLKESDPALHLLELREQALRRLNAGRNDLRLAKGWLLRARILTYRTDFDKALSWAERAADSARVIGSNLMLAEALQVQGQTLRQQGRLDAALARYQRALELYRRTDEVYLLARCLMHYGTAVLPTGDLDKAWSLFEESQSLAIRVPDEETWVDCLKGMALVALERRDVPRAHTLTQQALGYYTKEGNRHGMAACLNNLGECQRLVGDLDAAQASYLKTLEIFESLGMLTDSVGTRLNLALILLEKKQYAEARRAIDETLRIMREHGLKPRLGSTHCLNLAAVAGHRDWKAWDRHIEQVRHFVDDLGMAERDNAWSLQLAGDLAFQAGQKGRARDAYQLALTLWTALGAREKLAEIHKILSECT